ncbi:MAG: hypothetical protein M0R70_10220 [Nitrospirae bacterium]|nr:hypothetical protein [Nitrospirota bacterium]
MFIKLLKVVVAILLFMTACSRSHNSDVPSVADVTYRETSGSVSPDVAWDEKYTVSLTGLTFVRTGFSALTTVNTGTWTINSYGTNESKLLSDLSTADVYGVVKTGQGSAPIGGGIKDYTIQYDNGDTREVIIGDGSIYSNAALLTTPIDNYLSNVVLPAGASSRYK